MLDYNENKREKQRNVHTMNPSGSFRTWYRSYPRDESLFDSKKRHNKDSFVSPTIELKKKKRTKMHPRWGKNNERRKNTFNKLGLKRFPWISRENPRAYKRSPTIARWTKVEKKNKKMKESKRHVYDSREKSKDFNESRFTFAKHKQKKRNTPPPPKKQQQDLYKLQASLMRR